MVFIEGSVTRLVVLLNNSSSVVELTVTDGEKIEFKEVKKIEIEGRVMDITVPKEGQVAFVSRYSSILKYVIPGV